MYETIEKVVAVYELLHAHARNQTDLTEDQLANVVTGVKDEAIRILARARDGGPDPRMGDEHADRLPKH